jgi:hypothetical protein
MQNVSKGTTQDNLSLDKLLTFDFIVPDITTQCKIAAMLSAYDDLIENNTRRIAILEETAAGDLPGMVRPLPLPRPSKSKTNQLAAGQDSRGVEGRTP